MHQLAWPSCIITDLCKMSQPRTIPPFRIFSERLSMRRYYSIGHSQHSHRSQSRKLAKEKKMSRALPVDAMDVDSCSMDRHPVRNEQHGGTFLEDEKLDEQFVIVNGGTIANVPSNNYPNIPLEPASRSNDMETSASELRGTKITPMIADTLQSMNQGPQIGNFDKLAISETRVENPESSGMQRQLQQQINDLSSKVSSLESSALRQPSNNAGLQIGEEGGLSDELKIKYINKIQALEKTVKETEEQIHSLLVAQEPAMKYQTELEARYRAAINHIEKEKRAREESELNLRTEITTIRGAYQKEKERAQKLMKTMAEMQNADPFKMDNNSITGLVKELRYDIKNWVWAQRLIPSLPTQGLISTYASRALGGREKGPNYDFLKDVTPNFHEYTESSQDFKWVLQAYLWKRIVELIFSEDLWAGIRKPIDEEENEYKLQTGYRLMKMRLTPEDDTNQEYIAQFHEWRSNTARMLNKQISSERRKRTMEIIRDDILRPLYKAAEPMEQEIRNIEDLETVIDSAMRLGANIAQQKAFFTFEFVSMPAYGKIEFKPQHMTDPFPSEHFDSRTHFRTVCLNLAPRLIKYGTSEGTNFESCVQLLEGEVETKVVPKKLVVKRQVVH